VIYSYNKSQKDALFLKFILVKNSICFGLVYCPSSKLNSVALVRERTIPTERPPPVGEVSATFCG